MRLPSILQASVAIFAQLAVIGASPPRGRCSEAPLVSSEQWRAAASDGEHATSIQKGSSPELIWMKIRAVARHEAISRSKAFSSILVIKKNRRRIEFRFHLTAESDLGLENDNYRLPFAKQILIEDFRYALAQVRPMRIDGPRPERRSTDRRRRKIGISDYWRWQRLLNKAERIVKRTVVRVETEHDEAQLKIQLEKSGKEIDDLIYVRLIGSIADYAEAHQLIVSYERGGVPKPFSVSISSDPNGAKVWIMTGLVYQKQKALNVDPSSWPWSELVQSPAELIGRYRYKAEWPDGRSAEDYIDVLNAAPLRFRPQSKNKK